MLDNRQSSGAKQKINVGDLSRSTQTLMWPASKSELQGQKPPVDISRAPGRNPNPLKGFSQDLLNLRGPPQNPPKAGFEEDLSN